MTKLEKIEAINADLQAGRVSIGIDYGTEPSVTVTVTKCRCGLMWTDATAFAAHQERCFVVGDWVRYGSPVDDASWAEGQVVGPAKNCVHRGWLGIRISSASSFLAEHIGHEWSFGPEALRRIACPGQGVATEQPAWHCSACGIGVTRSQPIGDQLGRCQACSGSNAPTKQGVIMGRLGMPIGWLERPNLSKTAICAGTWTHGAELLHHCSQPADHEGNCYDGPPLRSEPLYVEPPAPTLYDGYTAERCLYQFSRNQQLEPGEPRYVMTPAMIDIARFLWSTQLRAKIAASRSAGRNQVVLEQDAEDLPWKRTR